MTGLTSTSRADGNAGRLRIGLIANGILVGVIGAGVYRYPATLIAFCLAFAFFRLVENVSPAHRLAVLRQSWSTDAIYFFAGPVLFGGVPAALLRALATLPHQGHLLPLAQLLPKTPAVQFGVAFLLGEVCYYWMHRLAHTVPFLWHFHSVHHSITSMDWIAGVRFHPVDETSLRLSLLVPFTLAGFSPAMFAPYAVLVFLINLLNHANVTLPVGPLRYIIATPGFHHWHHDLDGPPRNFSGLLPCLDGFFGTLIFSREMPRRYGIRSYVPGGFAEQMWYPFSGLLHHLCVRPLLYLRSVARKARGLATPTPENRFPLQDL